MLTNEVDAWTALGDPSRRRIFHAVTSRPQSVGELAADLPISRPAVSQHLKVLRAAELVRVHTAGTRRIYTVDTTGLSALRAELDAFWAQTLTNLKSVAESSAAPQSGTQTQTEET